VRLVPVFISMLALGTQLACAASSSSANPTPLEGTTWQLIEVNGRPVASAGERSAHLQFGPDSGRVVGSTGCNRLTGTYSRDGATLRFGPAATTRMACLDSQRNDQERDLLEALQATERHEIAGNTLALHSSARVVARFEAAQPR
jgi:putative lipoprotein